MNAALYIAPPANERLRHQNNASKAAGLDKPHHPTNMIR
jgi:hypothetical protein